MPTPLIVSEVFKSFTMHLRDGIELPVVRDVNFSVCSGECVVLGGPSGIGKSSILKMLYGNYAIDSGQILIRHEGEVVDIGSASPRTILDIRHRTIGYVSQFLRTVPRVAAIDVVAEPLLARRIATEEAREQAAVLLSKLNLPLSQVVNNSASTSPAASSPIMRSCCSTSQPLRLMPPTGVSSSR